MRITMRLLGVENTYVTYVLDRILDVKELENVHKGNAFKVGAAIGRRRLAKLGVQGVPVAVVFG